MSLDVSPDRFDAEVVERSFERPVLVDFWAPWCGPCRMMAPHLSRLAEECADRLDVRKLNTDEAPDVAARFGIRGIPNLKIFKDGKVAGELVGAVPYGELRRFVDEHVPSAAQRLVEEARGHLAAGAVDRARTLLEQAVAADPKHGPARLELARLAVRDGDEQAYEVHAAAVDPSAEEVEQIRNLRNALVFHRACEEAGGPAATRRRVTDAPDDPDSWYAHGACLAHAGEFEAALEAFLEAVKRIPRPADSAPHRAMLTLFTELGPHHPVAEEYKRKLQIYL